MTHVGRIASPTTQRRLRGLRARCEEAFGGSYDCRARNAAQLAQVFRGLCERHGIAMHITPYEPVSATQLSLF